MDADLGALPARLRPEQIAPLLQDCAQRWSLALRPPFPHLTYHYVAPASRADGTEAVLKIGVPGDVLAREAHALRWLDGRGSVRLLDADTAQGVLLLERLAPGVSLTTLADDFHDAAATSLAASVMRALWRFPPPDPDFPTTAQLGQDLQRFRAHFGGPGPCAPRLLEEAETLVADLLASAPPPVFLHGDLHHDNILSSGPAWRAIDPQGAVGEPAYETGALIRNLWLDRHALAHPQQIMARRIAQMSEELELDRARVRAWALVRTVLAAWWSIEDGEDGWGQILAIAEMLAAIQP